jgi:hypothetical protein
MSDPSDATGVYTWWQDKQVALKVGPDTVRGWVMRVDPQRNPSPAGPIGYITIVLFIADPNAVERYPSEVTVPLYRGGTHGRPDGVVGLWPEADVSDKRLPRTRPAASPKRL